VSGLGLPSSLPLAPPSALSANCLLNITKINVLSYCQLFGYVPMVLTHEMVPSFENTTKYLIVLSLSDINADCSSWYGVQAYTKKLQHKTVTHEMVQFFKNTTKNLIVLSLLDISSHCFSWHSTTMHSHNNTIIFKFPILLGLYVFSSLDKYLSNLEFSFACMSFSLLIRFFSNMQFSFVFTSFGLLIRFFFKFTITLRL